MTLVAASPERRLARALLPLGLVFLVVGVSTAIVEPFLSLFLNTAVHADPVRTTVFLVATPLSGVAAATVLGRVSDRWPIRRILLIGTSVAGLVGMGLTAVVRDYWFLLVLTATATALATTLFPQTFAYARQVLADGPHAAMGISTLRTVFSLAWVGGPPLGALLLHLGGFASLYGVSAALYALAALVALVLLKEAGASSPSTVDTGAAELTQARPVLLLTAVAFTLLQCPLTLAVQALPLFIGKDLGGDVRYAGIILGMCAALEIPLMLALGALTTRIRLRVLVLAGAGCGVAYYALAAVASSIWMLAVAQLLNALFIAAVAGLGISYAQDMLPGHPGRATTLYSNTFPIGAVLAGPLFGLAQHFGFRLAYVSSTALCAIGFAVLLFTRPVPLFTPAPRELPAADALTLPADLDKVLDSRLH
jgi:MFS transporter, SET family, sugar efflux transporter